MGTVCSCANLEMSYYYIQNLRVLKNRSQKVPQPAEQMNIGIVEIDTESKLLMRLFLVQSFCIKMYENKSSREKFDEVLLSSIKLNQNLWGSMGKDKFVQDYKETNPIDKDQFMIKTFFNNSQFQTAINKISIDIFLPESYPQYIMPISRLYNGIHKEHLSNTNKQYSKEFYIVTCLTKKEGEDLKNLQKISIKQKENLICFSKFMRAFSKENKKNAKKKFQKLKKQGKNPYLFTINISKQYPLLSMNQDEDRGFYVYTDPTERIKEQGDVLVNILNTYRLEVNQDENEIDLLYGYGAFLKKDKITNRSYNHNPQISHLIKFIDMASAITCQLKSQSFLLTEIEKVDLSEEISLQYIRETKYEVNKKLTEIELQNLINISIIRREYEKGLDYCTYSECYMTKAKRLQLLLCLKRYDSAKEQLKTIKLDTKIDENIEWKEKIYLIHAKMDIYSEKYKEASNKLQTLIRSLARHSENEDYMSREAQKFLAKAKKERDHIDLWDNFLRRSGLSSILRQSSDIM